ncbi:MAG: M56 family metallopeptidase [Bacteroidota bacterium]
MITYLLKSSFCLLLFWGVYEVFFKKETFYVFNRWFLLGSLIASCIIPLCVTKVQYVEVPFKNVEIPALVLEKSKGDMALKKISDPHQVPWKEIYLLGLLVMGLRFIRNFWHIRSLILGGKIVSHGRHKLVFHTNITYTFSFFSFIFFPSSLSLDSGNFDILYEHERVHADQWHSIDNLFLELLCCIYWFNPLFFFYRRAIRLNHEFLADHAVLQRVDDPTHYLGLLYSASAKSNLLRISSRFSNSHIHKRILMMNKQSRTSRIYLYQFMVLPLVMGLLFVFGKSQSIVKDTETGPGEPRVKLFPLSENQLQVPEVIYELFLFDGGMRAITTDPKGKDLPYEPTGEKRKYILASVSGAAKLSFHTPEGNTVEKIVSDLSKEERKWVWKLDKSNAQYYDRPVPSKQPSEDEWENFFNSSVYGVWLDGQRIENAELNRYSPSDIHHYGVSKLMKNAANYGKHVFQLNLTTHQAVEDKFGPGGKGFWKPLTLDGSFIPPFVRPN